MSDLQPGSRDVVIRQRGCGYVVETFSASQSQIVCTTYLAALMIANDRARSVGGDVWFVDEDAPWRVRRFAPPDGEEA
jgi:hypothetical protein